MLLDCAARASAATCEERVGTGPPARLTGPAKGAEEAFGAGAYKPEATEGPTVM